MTSDIRVGSVEALLSGNCLVRVEAFTHSVTLTHYGYGFRRFLTAREGSRDSARPVLLPQFSDQQSSRYAICNIVLKISLSISSPERYRNSIIRGVPDCSRKSSAPDVDTV